MTVSLRILLVAGRETDRHFAERVLEEQGDRVVAAPDVTNALAELSREPCDLVLTTLAMPRGDGLAFIHHVRALYPSTDVVVMSTPSEIEDVAHAMSLGVSGNLLLPLSGDALLVAANRARERLAVVHERSQLAEASQVLRRRTLVFARAASMVSEPDARAVLTRALALIGSEIGASEGAAYALHGDGALHRACGDERRYPPLLDAFDDRPEAPVQRLEGELRVVVSHDGATLAVLCLALPGNATLPPEQRDVVLTLSSLVAASLAVTRRFEAVSRTGIKDPETSAYTFAYFGDVAGREIDRAGRYGRRFALVTIDLDATLGSRGPAFDVSDARVELRRSVADAVLEAVRDSDVLARVEDDEFYLLLPETGLLGALSCRRRVVASVAAACAKHFAGFDPPPPVVGLSIYPTDGGDLGRLLRASRRRSDRARRSVSRRLGLTGMPFWTAVEQLLGSEDDTAVRPDGSVSLHADLVRAHDELSLARHAVFSPELLARLGATLTHDALRNHAAGTMYTAGDIDLSAAVARSIASEPGGKLRAWVLDSSREGARDADVERVRLQVDDPRLAERVILLSLTELGGFAFLGRKLPSGDLLAYHGADLDLVDGLVTSLQAVYHLQPEVR